MTRSKKPAWRKRLIRLRLKENVPYKLRPRIEAEVIGALAVHPYYDPKAATFCDGRFTLTHMGTKAAIRQDVNREVAREIAEKLVGLNWDFNAAHKMSAETKASAVNILRQYPSGRAA